MTTFSRLLTLMICFEFILAPINIRLLSIGPSLSATAEECQGMGLILAEGRCITTAEQAQLRRDLSRCEAMTDAAAKRACLTQNATNARDTKFNENQGSTTLDFNGVGGTEIDGGRGGNQTATAVSGVAMVVPLFFLISTLGDKDRQVKNCTPWSLMLLYAGSAVLLAGEIGTFIGHRIAIDKLQKEWEEKTAQDTTNKVDAKDTQSEAFGFLADNEKTKKETSTWKAGFYIAAAATFTAGLVASIVEQVQLTTARAQLAYPAMAPTAQQQINDITCAYATKNEVKKSEQDEEKKQDDELNKAKDKKDQANKEYKDMQETCKDKATKVCEANLEKLKAQSDEADKSYQSTEEKHDKNIDEIGTRRNNETSDDAKKVSAAAAEADAKASADSQAAMKKAQEESDARAVEEAAKAEADNKKIEESSGQEPPPESAPAPTPAPAGAPTGVPASHHGVPGVYIKFEDLFKNKNENFEIKKILSKNYERVAIHNISTATDTYNLTELMMELKSIEFDNYSKSAYLPENEITLPLKESKLTPDMSKVIASVFGFKDAFAKDDVPPPPKKEEGIDMKVVMGGVEMVGKFIPQAGGKKLLEGTVDAGGMAPKIPEARDNAEKTAGDVIHEPLFRGGANLLMGTWTGVVGGFLVKQANIYAEREKILRDIKTSFDNQSGALAIACSENDRKSPSKPNCYCFTADFKRNEARSNSQVCSALFGTPPSYKPMSYLSQGGTTFCVNKKQEVDTACACKAKNNCSRITGPNNSGLNLGVGANRMIGANTAMANDLMSGRTSGANINAGAAISNAARTKAAALKMLNPKDAKKMNDFAKKVETGMLKATQGLTMNGGRSGAMGNGDLSKMTPAQAAAALQKEFKENKEKSKDIVASPTYGQPGAAKEQLEFGMTQEDLAAQETEVAEVMKQKLDFNQNDINNASKQNIFEVLSNRYQRSGMRRLFDESGKSKPEKANADDINK